MRALDLRVRALAPRRSHSDFSVHQIFESSPGGAIAHGRNSSFLFQKLTVVAVDAERTLGIDPIEFHHVGRHILKKVAVVADDDASESGLFKKIL